MLHIFHLNIALNYRYDSGIGCNSLWLPLLLVAFEKELTVIWLHFFIVINSGDNILELWLFRMNKRLIKACLRHSKSYRIMPKQVHQSSVQRQYWFNHFLSENFAVSVWWSTMLMKPSSWIIIVNIKCFCFLAWDVQNHHAPIRSNAPKDTANHLFFNWFIWWRQYVVFCCHLQQRQCSWAVII